MSALTPTARCLIGARTARSVGQGALVADFALYLHALGWSAVAIGGVFMAGLLTSSVFTLLLGPLSDRFGRRSFLLGYEVSQVIAAVAALLTANGAVLVAATVVGGFGRGAQGSPGPFAPVEQAWLAGEVAPRQRGAVFSLNAGLGFFGMAGGALLAMLPAVFGGTPVPGDAYRLLFGIVLLGSLVSIALLRRTRDAVPSPDADGVSGQAAEGGGTRQLQARENTLLLRLMGVNALNGLAIGLIGPMLAYWFLRRFGVGPAAIAPMMSLAFVATGLASLVSARLTRHLGVVGVVVWLRVIALLLLVPMALAPSFTWAAVLYVIRSALNRGTIGARQALGVSLVRARRRGLAVSLNNVSLLLPLAFGPLVAGLLFQAGLLLAPFFLAAGLQGVNLYLYQRLFRGHDPVHRSKP